MRGRKRKLARSTADEGIIFFDDGEGMIFTKKFIDERRLWGTPWIRVTCDPGGSGDDLGMEFHKTRPDGKYVYRIEFDEGYERATVEFPVRKAWVGHWPQKP